MEVSRVTPATRMLLPSRMPTDVPSAFEKVVRSSSVAHAEAAVDRDHCPGDVACRVAGEELDRPRDIGHRAEPPQRNLLGVLLDQILAERSGHVGLDETGSHHIRRYAA